MSAEPIAMTESPPSPADAGWPAWADLLAAAGGSLLALLLLWYLHGAWQPLWALVCGGLGGAVLRRLVRPSYASFPPYLRQPLNVGVIVLGTIVASWATIVREPASVWLLRWREVLTLPLVAAALGIGLAGVVYSHSRMRREIEETRARAAALREATLEARLRALQAQINPHFLFNALNALAELTHDDPEVAEQLVGDLAHLLRYSLRSSAVHRVPLSQELEAVNRYLRVENARLGERLRVERRIDSGALNVQVPGLVLQPVVENAVQHAVATRAGGGRVHIEVRREPDAVLIRVEDDGPGIPPETVQRLESFDITDRPEPYDPARGKEGAGGGIFNVLQRIALAYRGRASLAVTDAGPGTRVEIRIPT